MEGGEIKRTRNRKMAEKKKVRRRWRCQIKKKNQKIIVNIGKRGGEIKKAIYKEDLQNRKVKEKK